MISDQIANLSFKGFFYKKKRTPIEFFFNAIENLPEPFPEVSSRLALKNKCSDRSMKV